MNNSSMFITFFNHIIFNLCIPSNFFFSVTKYYIYETLLKLIKWYTYIPICLKNLKCVILKIICLTFKWLIDIFQRYLYQVYHHFIGPGKEYTGDTNKYWYKLHRKLLDINGKHKIYKAFKWIPILQTHSRETIHNVQENNYTKRIKIVAVFELWNMLKTC